MLGGYLERCENSYGTTYDLKYIYSTSHKKVKVPYRTCTVPLANLESTTNHAVRFGSVRFSTVRGAVQCSAVRIFPVSRYPRLLRIINNAHQARRCWRSPAILVPT